MASSSTALIPDKQQESIKEEIYGTIEKFEHLIKTIGKAIGISTPSAHITSIKIPKINLHEAQFAVEILLQNPTPIHIPRIQINYSLTSNGHNLISGAISDSVTIKSRSSHTLTLPINLKYNKIRSTLTGSVIPYRIEILILADVCAIGRISIGVEETGEIPIPRALEVEILRIKFERFDLEETEAVVELKVGSRQEFELGVKSVECEVWIDGIGIGGAKVEECGESCVEVPVKFRPKEFGSALWEMMSGKGTEYSMKGSVCVDTRFGVMDLEFGKEGGSTKFKKVGEGD